MVFLINGLKLLLRIFVCLFVIWYKLIILIWMFKILGFIYYNLLRYVVKFLKSLLFFRFLNE